LAFQTIGVKLSADQFADYIAGYQGAVLFLHKPATNNGANPNITLSEGSGTLTIKTSTG
jgi:hypothetical protein